MGDNPYEKILKYIREQKKMPHVATNIALKELTWPPPSRQTQGTGGGPGGGKASEASASEGTEGDDRNVPPDEGNSADRDDGASAPGKADNPRAGHDAGADTKPEAAGDEPGNGEDQDKC